MFTLEYTLMVHQNQPVKKQSEYTVHSGVLLQPLSKAYITIMNYNLNTCCPLLQLDIVEVYPCAIANDGTALKPSIETKVISWFKF